MKRVAPRRFFATALVGGLGFFFTWQTSLYTPLFSAVLTFAWVLALVLMQSRVATLRPFLDSLAEKKFPHATVWTLVGLGFVVASLVNLELRFPFYFSQDDNHSCYLPVWLTALDGFFSTGALPTWNAYQFLGSPTTSLGIYALTYPVTYFSYFMSRFVFGNELWTMEVFGFVHFIAGYWFTAAALRILGARPALAASGALGYTLLGFHLIAGRSWFYMIPTVAYFPALALSLATYARSHRAPSRRWFLGTAAAMGLYFHSGSVQMWFYGMAFWSLGVTGLWLTGQRTEKSMRAVGAALLLGVALTLPLLLVQAEETKAIPRRQFNDSIAGGLDGLILPWPITHTELPWGRYRPTDTGFYFSGLFVGFFFLQFAFVLAGLGLVNPTRRQSVTLGICLFALIAFVFALGPSGYLWTFFQAYPPFNKFRVPFRLLPYAAFFAVAGGVVMAERFSRRIRWGNQFALGAATLSAVCSLWNGSLNYPAFYVFKEPPYTPLRAEQNEWVAKTNSDRGRVFALGSWRSSYPGYTRSLMQNYASYYRIPSAQGYDTDSLEQHLPETADAMDLSIRNLPKFLREYGVQRVTFFKAEGDGVRFSAKTEKLVRQIASEREDYDDLGVYSVWDPKNTRPMAYFEAAPTKPLLYDVVGNGFNVHTPAPSTDSILIANFLHRHWFTAWTDRGQTLRPYADAMGRLAFAIPAGTAKVFVRYSPPWGQGIFAGAIIALLAGWLWDPKLLTRIPHLNRLK